MKVSFLYIQRRLKVLSVVRAKEYTIEPSFNGYHLMCDGKFLVADESLAVLNVVIGALLRDTPGIESTNNTGEVLPSMQH